LIIFNEPTPEDAFLRFESVWEQVKEGTASTEDRQTFARVCLSVLGKNIAVSESHKLTLKDALTNTVVSLVPQDQQSVVTGGNPQQASTLAVEAIGLEPTGLDQVRIGLLPYSLVSNPSGQLSEEIPKIMALYLIHNSSFLTELRFLGFPFHYWYTAQFLLILFVGLCLVYAYQTDRSNQKYNFPDE
jgi:putative solute:sodium symporter small subunit